MHPATKKAWAATVRLLKGILDAWGKWLDERD